MTYKPGKRFPLHGNIDVVLHQRNQVATGAQTGATRLSSEDGNGHGRKLHLALLLDVPPQRNDPDVEHMFAVYANLSRDAEEERAAIVEYDMGAPRAWAEGFARLDPNDAPADVPPLRWLRFTDDCGGFLDGGWARQAAVFGWGPLDLFGCDRQRPFARVDHAGLVWLLNGRKLVAFTAHTATIATLSGAHQTYRRGSIAFGEVTLAWRLCPLEGGKHKPDETPNDSGALSEACAYCGRGKLPGSPLLDAAVDGVTFRAHRTCLDLEWQSWQREPTKVSCEFCVI
jgi:hypothetical protein